MTVEVKVPVLPESVADAVIAGWHKQAGDSVRQDEPLVDLETDKVVLEVPAISDGVITEIRFGEGETVTAEQVIALIDDSVSVNAVAAPAIPEHAPAKAGQAATVQSAARAPRASRRGSHHPQRQSHPHMPEDFR